MSDLIDRQQALSVVRNLREDFISKYKIDALLIGLPSAEPEQKKGHWVKVGGYFTPGGDPVWKCSECGKGIHVYGIEANSYNRDYTDGHQWVACPNCGADMRGDENENA